MTAQRNGVLFLCFISLIVVIGASVTAQTPVQRHGWLKTTDDGYLVNESGKIVQLRGMSFYWSNGDFNGEQWYTAATLDALVDTWKCTVVRLSYNPNSDASEGWKRCETVLNRAIARGIYVIIDWHSHNAHEQSEANRAISFFTEKAKVYKDKPNVIFEPYNEPKWAGGAGETANTDNATKTWKAIKPYLTNVTKAIRDQGSKNLIILGTPFFAQFVGIAADDQVVNSSGKPFENVAYAFHFYSASHGPEAYYVKNGTGGGEEGGYLENGLGKIPIFITEWGTTHSDGGQPGHDYIDGTNTDWWFSRYINGKYHISWCNWSVSDFERSSAFSGSHNNPSASGAIAKKHLTNQSTDTYNLPSVDGLDGPAKDSTFTMPGFHAAFSYNKFFGGNIKEATVAYSNWDKQDSMATKVLKHKVLSIPSGVQSEWASYKINSTSATKNLFIRYFAANSNGKIDVLVDGTSAGQITISKNTQWSTLITPINIPSGNHTLTFKFNNSSGAPYLISWFRLTNDITATINTALNPLVKAAASVEAKKGSILISLTSHHNFSSLTLIGADGRVAKSTALGGGISTVTLNDLANGIWFVKLHGLHGTKLFKTVVSGQ